MINYYDILGIHPNANNEEINKAYKIKAAIYHPDKNNGSQAAEEMFKLIAKAKEELLNPVKRLEHDILIGIRKRPIINIPNENNTAGMVIGFSALALLIGLAIGSNVGKR